MAHDALSRALADLETPAPTLYSGPVSEPPKDHERRRALLQMEAAPDDEQPALSIDDARADIRHKMTEYLDIPNPDHILLVALPPGSGKTTEAVRQAELWAGAARGRVLYAGVRHNLWDDLMKASTIPAAHRDQWWYHWQPHTEGDAETGQGQTCRYARQFRAWAERGYPGIEFCKKKAVCATYMKRCVYLKQKDQNQPIVFVQHADIALGHPFLEQATLLIGDESPLDAFLHLWQIPARDIVPPSLWKESEPNTELIELLRTLRDLVDQTPPKPESKRLAVWEGAALIEALGGAAHVAAVCDTVKIVPGSKAAIRLWGPDQAESLPYWHLSGLAGLLKQEALEAMAGRPAACRVRITMQGLELLLRRPQRPLPSHVIWLDATANPALYKAVFQEDKRRIEVVAPRVQLAGRVYQVWPSLNNKDTLIGLDQEREGKRPAKRRSEKRETVERQVDHIIQSRGYARPAIVTYKDLTGRFSGYDTAHFYGLRGTNRLQECDALIVIGTPQASIPALVDQAAMLHQEILRPFDTDWSDRDQRYAGHDRGYPVSGFWHDTTLHALLAQTREAELVQAAHRVRPLYRKVDVWLLTNLPLAALPPDELLDIRGLFGAPAGIDPYRWPELVRLLGSAGDDGLSVGDIYTQMDVPERTALRWHTVLRTLPGVICRTRTSNGGRPAIVCVKDFCGDFPPRVL